MTGNGHRNIINDGHKENHNIFYSDHDIINRDRNCNIIDGSRDFNHIISVTGCYNYIITRGKILIKVTIKLRATIQKKVY